MTTKKLLLITFYSLAVFSYIKPKQIPLNSFTHQVHRRLYIHRRLKPALRLLKMHFKNKAFTLEKDIEHIEFSHTATQETLKTILEKNSLNPLFDLWKSISSYKHLDDNLLIEEFIKIVFIVYQELIILEKKDGKHHPLTSGNFNIWMSNYNVENKPLDNCSSGELLRAIDIMQESLKSIIYKKPSILYNLKAYENFIEFEQNNIDAKLVSKRLYYIRRIKKNIKKLQHCEPLLQAPWKDALNKKNEPSCPSCKAYINIPFKHDRVKGCLTQLRKEANNLKLLDPLWEDLYSFRFIDNDEFVKEFSSLILIIADLINKNNIKSPHQQRVTPADILDLYAKISAMHIDEILETIDELINHLEELAEDYELREVNTVAWWKKYWWVPPSVVIIVMIKYYSH